MAGTGFAGSSSASLARAGSQQQIDASTARSAARIDRACRAVEARKTGICIIRPEEAVVPSSLFTQKRYTRAKPGSSAQVGVDMHKAATAAIALGSVVKFELLLHLSDARSVALAATGAASGQRRRRDIICH